MCSAPSREVEVQAEQGNKGTVHINCEPGNRRENKLC